MNEVRRWLVRGVLLFLLSFANLNDLWSPDVVPNGLFAWTLLRERDVDYDEFTTGADPIDRETYFFRACGASTATGPSRLARSAGGPPQPGPEDRVCSIFPPGAGLLALPFFGPFVLAGAQPDVALVVRGGHVVAAALESLAALLLWGAVRRFVEPRVALGLVLLYLLGTSVRTVGSQALWQHPGVHLALAFVLWQLVRDGPVTPARARLAGLVLGLGSAIRQTTAIFLPFVVAASWRGALAGFVVGIAPLFVYSQLAFGTPLEQGYGTKPFEPSSALGGLAGLLVSPSRGLFVYEPWSIAAIASLALAWRRSGETASRLRWIGLSALALLLLYASYAEWWGGRVFGPRFLDDLAPAFVVALAWGIGQGILGGARRRVAFALGAIWSLTIFQAAAFVYDGRWDLEPVNVNFAPERLFDWSDPQWLAVLRDLPANGSRALAAAALTALILAVLVRVERDGGISSRR